MSHSAVQHWSRYVYRNTPVYVCDSGPDWFVPNGAGDRLLRELSNGRAAVDDVHGRRFLHRIGTTRAGSYPGRDSLLALDSLKEVWLHITNRCNLSCRHCLFASSPDDTGELCEGRVLALAGEALNSIPMQ